LHSGSPWPAEYAPARTATPHTTLVSADSLTCHGKTQSARVGPAAMLTCYWPRSVPAFKRRRTVMRYRSPLHRTCFHGTYPAPTCQFRRRIYRR
jgi:hypothetical protein